MPSGPRNADPEWLIGLRAMAAFMGVSERTIRRWIANHGFPAGLMPSGHWLSSKRSIRDWVMVRGQQVVEQRRRAAESDRQSAGLGCHGSPPASVDWR